jgi:hypothetical protein
MREVLTLVERDFAGLVPRVRAVWDALEDELARAAAAADAEADHLRRRGDHARAADVLTAAMEHAVVAWSARAEQLVRGLTEGA